MGVGGRKDEKDNRGGKKEFMQGDDVTLMTWVMK